MSSDHLYVKESCDEQCTVCALKFEMLISCTGTSNKIQPTVPNEFEIEILLNFTK